jgi:hypothetical protein
LAQVAAIHILQDQAPLVIHNRRAFHGDDVVVLDSAELVYLVRQAFRRNLADLQWNLDGDKLLTLTFRQKAAPDLAKGALADDPCAYIQELGRTIERGDASSVQCCISIFGRCRQ